MSPKTSPRLRDFSWCLLVVMLATACVSDPGPTPRDAAAMGTDASQTLWIVGARIVDPGAGALTAPMDMAIAGEVVEAVLPAGSVPPSATRVIAGEGRFLMPGLWDMHVHVADAGYLDQFVGQGVLCIRDMGDGLDSAGNGCESLGLGRLQQLEVEIASGSRLGPDMVLAGPALSGTGWPTSLPARSGAEARASVGQLARQRADFIKVYDGLSAEAFRGVAEEARARELWFAGHVPESVDMLEAIELGQRSIEHVRDGILVCFTDDLSELEAFFLEDGWTESDRAWGRQAHARCPAILEALERREAWLTPTLVVERSKVAVEDPAYLHDPRRDVLPASVREGVLEHARRKAAQDEGERRCERLWWRTQRALDGRLGRAGIPLLAGTDAACEGVLPGHSLHEELVELVSAGLSPAQALRAATAEPARYLERTNEGSVAAGQRANLLLLSSNPLEDIRHTRSIVAVILRGEVVRSEASGSP